MTSGPDPGEFPGFWGSMVFRHAPIPQKGSGNQQQQQRQWRTPCRRNCFDSTKKKEVLHALDTIRRRLQFKGEVMDIFLRLEKQMQDSMQNNIKQTTIAQYFTLNE